ncbi:uncharacterized protein LOC125809279 [Solanum verrucosum]|uniref:uncharacterized protein LOC125809279 n=1 Tax=Solanum verrucosum TaxID=315347 RepID=UPI0020D16BA3|nr:uncharacterized protein LOC125809279 [Solanum verrucosum]
MVSDSVQKLDGTIEEDAANVDGSVPKRPHLEEKANGSALNSVCFLASVFNCTPGNPHNPKRYTRGSSSDSAVIVDSGLCSAALRTNGGGSVGIHASLCGVVGLKTTFGRTDMIGSLWEAGTVPIIGPITATLEDAILVLVCSNLGTSPADRIRLNPAFILMFDFTCSDIDMDMYDKADKLLYSSLNEWGLLLAASDNLNHVWAQTLVDPFLRRLILRDIQQNGT